MRVRRAGARRQAERPARRLGAALSLFAAASLLVGCVAPSTRPPADPADAAARVAALASARDTKLRAFERFRVRGSLGVLTEETSLVARIDWRQTPSALSLRLEGPFGFGAARLDDAEGVATFRRGDAPPLVDVSADRVLQRALGLEVPVPLGQLALWLRGLPGEAEEVRRDSAGRLETLRWSDASGTLWRARVRRYTTFEDLELPSLLTASGGGQHLRLALRDWSEDPAIPARSPSGAIEPPPTAPPGGATSRRLPVPMR